MDVFGSGTQSSARCLIAAVLAECHKSFWRVTMYPRISTFMQHHNCVGPPTPLRDDLFTILQARFANLSFGGSPVIEDFS